MWKNFCLAILTVPLGLALNFVSGYRAEADGLSELIGCQLAEYKSEREQGGPPAVYVQGVGFFVPGRTSGFYAAVGSNDDPQSREIDLQYLRGEPTSNPTRNWKCITRDPTIPNLTTEIKTMYTDQLNGAVLQLTQSQEALSKVLARTLAIQLTVIENEVEEVRQILTGIREETCPKDDGSCENDPHYLATLRQIERMDQVVVEVCALKEIYNLTGSACGAQ